MCVFFEEIGLNEVKRAGLLSQGKILRRDVEFVEHLALVVRQTRDSAGIPHLSFQPGETSLNSLFVNYS
jgi:hypothetical protein